MFVDILQSKSYGLALPGLMRESFSTKTIKFMVHKLLAEHHSSKLVFLSQEQIESRI
jgi:hypothetical protein